MGILRKSKAIFLLSLKKEFWNDQIVLSNSLCSRTSRSKSDLLKTKNLTSVSHLIFTFKVSSSKKEFEKRMEPEWSFSKTNSFPSMKPVISKVP